MKSYFSTNRVLAWTITGVAVATIFFACKKQVTTDTAPNNQTDNNTLTVTQHETVAASMYADLFDETAKAAVLQGLDKAGARQATPGSTANADAPGCPSLELLDGTGTTWPKHVRIDYGTSCQDRFGVFRSGVINIIFNGPMFNAGATTVIETDGNYKRNGIGINGRLAISGVTWDNTKGLQYTTDLTRGKLSLSDSVIIDYISHKTVKQIAGVDQVGALINPSDDVYSIEGNASITYEKGPLVGVPATFTTVEALIKRWDCQYISKGKLQIAFNKITGVLDYGDGKCDNDATITVGDKTKAIKL